MNFPQLVERVYRKNEYTKSSVKKILKSAYATILEALSHGEEVVIKGHVSYLFNDIGAREYTDPFGNKQFCNHRKKLRIRAGSKVKKATGFHTETRWQKAKRKKRIREAEKRANGELPASSSRMSAGRLSQAVRLRDLSYDQSEDR